MEWHVAEASKSPSSADQFLPDSISSHQFRLEHVEKIHSYKAPKKGKMGVDKHSSNLEIYCPLTTSMVSLKHEACGQ